MPEKRRIFTDSPLGKVIVAAEMLNGGAGIGFWLWDEYNASNYEHIIIAIFVVGIIGLLLELGLSMLAKRFAYDFFAKRFMRFSVPLIKRSMFFRCAQMTEIPSMTVNTIMMRVSS